MGMARSRRRRRLEVVLRWPIVWRTSLYFVLGLMLIIMGEDGGQPFIYFQF